MPHFRGILLAPQSRSDDAGTQWSWREPVDSASLNAAEFATVRKRLASAQLSFADPAQDAPATDTRRATGILPQVQARMNEVVASLSTKPDSELANYIVRSERGLMLHSWGLATALKPFYPDALDCEIAGIVLVADTPAPDFQVLLENTDHTVLARTRSDSAGKFRFPKISSGRYRVRVASERVAFAADGVDVDIEHTSVTGIELRDGEDQQLAAPASSADGAASLSRHRLLLSVIALFLVTTVGGLWWWMSGAHSPSASSAPSHDTKPTPTTTALSHTEKSATAPTSVRATASSPASDGPAASGVSSTNALPRMGPSLRDSPGQSSATTSADLGITKLGTAMSSHPVVGAPTSSSGPASATSPAGISPGSAGAASSGAPGSGSAHGNASAASGSPGSTTAASGSAGASSTAAAPTNAPPKSGGGAEPSTTPPAVPHAAVSTTSPNTTAIPPDAAPSIPFSTPPTDSPPTNSNANATTPATRSESPPDTKPNPDPATRTTPSPASSDSKIDRSSVDEVRSVSAKTAEAPPPDTPPVASEKNSTDKIVAAPTATTVTSAGFRRIGIRSTSWQPRLLDDAILPTQPTKIGEDDMADVMREHLFQERRRRIPALLKSPFMEIGFATEVSSTVIGSGPIRWRTSTGGTPSNATALGTRAEFFWPAIAADTLDCTLLAADGRKLARVVGDPRTGVTLFIAPDVRGWPWIAIERAPLGSTDLSATEWASRLEWRVLNGAAAPSTWQRNDQWLANRGHRLDLLVASGENGTIARTIALVDTVTGWSITSQIEQTREVSEPAQLPAR